MKHDFEVGKVILAVSTFLLVVLYYSIDSTKTIDLQVEIFKFLLLVSLVGGASLVHRGLKAEEASNNRNIEALKEFRVRALQVFHRVKHLRRMLKFHSDIKDEKIVFDHRFRELIDQLCATQLEVEMLRREVQVAAENPLFPNDVSRDSLKKIDEYLRNILKEFEDHCENYSCGMEITKFSTTYEFLYDTEKPTYVEAMRAMNNSLSGLFN